MTSRKNISSADIAELMKSKNRNYITLSELGELSKKRKEALVKQKESNFYPKNAVYSLAQWIWRRFGGNEVKGQGYNHYVKNDKQSTVFKIEGKGRSIKEMYSGYWDEWTDIINKYVEFKNGVVHVKSNGIVYVSVPGKLSDKEADKWLENNFGSYLMSHPEEAKILNSDKQKESSPAENNPPNNIKVWLKDLILEYLKHYNDDVNKYQLELNEGDYSYKLYLNKGIPYNILPRDDIKRYNSTYSMGLHYVISDNSTRLIFNKKRGNDLDEDLILEWNKMEEYSSDNKDIYIKSYKK